MINKMSNTTRLIDKLILKGYVDRIICKKNRRKVEITITNDGLEALKLIDKKIEEVEKTIIKDFNEKEIDTLNDLLDKLRT
jgi:DNA-binding MarR family transcriptional regulator